MLWNEHPNHSFDWLIWRTCHALSSRWHSFSTEYTAKYRRRVLGKRCTWYSTPAWVDGWSVERIIHRELELTLKPNFLFWDVIRYSLWFSSLFKIVQIISASWLSTMKQRWANLLRIFRVKPTCITSCLRLWEDLWSWRDVRVSFFKFRLSSSHLCSLNT